MSYFMNMWKKPDVMPPQRPTEMVSQVLIHTNEIFKIFLNKCSWFVYFIAGFIIVCCIYYFIYDCRRRMELRRRREDVQRATERIPQRRRPGAVHREHEIFRNAIRTVRQYIGNKEMPRRQQCESYVLKRTRSGAIYGHYADNEHIAG